MRYPNVILIPLPQRHIMQCAATSRMGTYTSCYKITPIIIWVFRPIKLNGHFRSLHLIHLTRSPPPTFKTNSFMVELWNNNKGTFDHRGNGILLSNILIPINYNFI